MPKIGDIRQQVERETHRRSRLAVAAFGGGFLYLLSAIIISQTLSGAPTVGLLQGLQPALSGEASPAVSPRTEEVRFISHHAFALIAGSVLVAIAIGVLALVLLVLLDATRFRRPETWSAAGPLVIGGGAAVALVSLAHQVVTAVETHNFAVGHDFTNHAVEQALTKGTANSVIDYVDLLAGLSLAAGMITVMINAMRVGLLPRWMSFLGMFAAVLIFLPIGGAELQLVVAFWIVMMGILYAGKWPNGEPPAWQAGEAVPWASRADMQTGARKGTGQPALAGAAADASTAAGSSTQQAGTSRKRRRKRGARG